MLHYAFDGKSRMYVWVTTQGLYHRINCVHIRSRWGKFMWTNVKLHWQWQKNTEGWWCKSNCVHAHLWHYNPELPTCLLGWERRWTNIISDDILIDSCTTRVNCMVLRKGFLKVIWMDCIATERLLLLLRFHHCIFLSKDTPEGSDTPRQCYERNRYF